MEPRTEISARIRSRVREISQRETQRVTHPDFMTRLRRYFTPLAYAGSGALITALLVFSVTGPGNSPTSIPDSTNMASASEYNIPTRMLRSDEITPALILPGVEPKATTPDGEDAAYATGLETPVDVRLVNYMY